MRHVLKTLPPYFERILSGEKTFEVRKNDRDFQVGDVLELVYHDPKDIGRGCATTRYIEVTVEYILYGGQFGIEPGHVVMTIKKV